MTPTRAGGTVRRECACAEPGPRQIDVPHIQLGGALLLGVGLVLTFAVSLWFAIMVDFTLSAVTTTAIALLAGYRCDRCQERIEGEDLRGDERRRLRTQQGIALAMASVMAAVALWAKGNWDVERGMVRALQRAERTLEEIDPAAPTETPPEPPAHDVAD